MVHQSVESQGQTHMANVEKRIQEKLVAAQAGIEANMAHQNQRCLEQTIEGIISRVETLARNVTVKEISENNKKVVQFVRDEVARALSSVPGLIHRREAAVVARHPASCNQSCEMTVTTATEDDTLGGIAPSMSGTHSPNWTDYYRVRCVRRRTHATNCVLTV